MASKFYQKHKERLRKEVRGRYQNLSEEEKEKKSQVCFQNFTEEEKEKKHQYYQECKQKHRKNYYLAHKK